MQSLRIQTSAGRAAMLAAAIGLFLTTALLSVAALPGKKPSPRPTTLAKLRYNRDIRPILAENCFACHGPDSASRKAGLRLDRPADARAPRNGSAAIVPGKPADSLMVQRISTTVAPIRMPPPASHKTLTSQQIAMLTKWVAQGAEYEPHWAYIPPKRPPLPAVKNAAWVRNPVDRFILAKLEQAGLAPAPEADRRTLARRLSLDLTGLPPEPGEVERFVADRSPDAYERLVDRLMAKPEWGEHRARYWLDAARYADTHGIHFDNYREIWAYRDWVINAFNANMPFDRFTIEQLAGDLLPSPSLDQLVATGFTRCNITTNEGGAIDEEYAVLYTRDRTETAAQVWLGTTAGCAVCHDHKFDPLTQKEFYALSAFFNNTTQKPMDGNIQDTPPVIPVPRMEDRTRWTSLQAEIKTARQQADARKQAARTDFDRWLGEAKADDIAKTVPGDGLRLHLPLAEGQGREVTGALDGQPLRLAAAADPGWVIGQVASKAFQRMAGSAVEIPQAGDFEKEQAFSCAAWVKLPANAGGAIVARMDDEHDFRGWDMWVEGSRVGTHIIHKWPDDALKVVAREPLAADRWHHVCITYTGGANAGAVKVYVDGSARDTETQADRLKNTIRTTVPLKLGQRHTTAQMDGTAVQDMRLYDRALSPEEVARLAHGTRAQWLVSRGAAQLAAPEKDELYSWWLPGRDELYRTLSAKVTALEAEERTIRARGTNAFIAQERGDPPMAYVLFRGEYDKRRDPVKPDTPAMLPPMPKDFPRNRLGFAKWLLLPEHPLTTRVTVNRIWQELFGQGLVRTAGDFGVTGELPSHPELLDWLAVEFRTGGWDMKRFYKMLVTSATYRQSALMTPLKKQKDPQDRLLSRGPRFRMDAEMVRDGALAASGLLVHRVGGPSVRPYQPDGVWEAVAMIGSNTRDYKRDSGDSLYRRSLYTFWKRSAPPAAMDIFNAPSRETCTVRRERTNTPLQALATLNDVQYVEAARVLAQNALKQGGMTPAAQVDYMARRLLARPLRAEEQAVVVKSLADLGAFYRNHPKEARELIAYGESKADAGIAPETLAVWTMLANQLMNLDEVLNK